MRSLLIRLLGGVSGSEYQKILSELKDTQDEMGTYKEFAKSIYVYAGNYPAWKAQAEFRQLMNDLNCPVSDDSLNLSNKSAIDTYLGRIVDGLQILIHEQEMIPSFAIKSERWSPESLEHVRGRKYLAKNSNKSS